MTSIYIHWPFCLSKCCYCDFGSKVISRDRLNSDFQKNYLKCCEKQLYYFYSKINKKDTNISSIYFGGGTPSLLKPEIIGKLIEQIYKLFNVEENCEITLEANPTSFELNKFNEFKNCGVNRVSLGVQSMNDDKLVWLGRKHSVKDAIDAIIIIKKLFPKWSFDLIYALPNQTIKEWINELKIALSLSPQHLSLYTLIVDNSTRLGKLVAVGKIKEKSEDEKCYFYDETNSYIKYNSNLRHYEVSNYSIAGYESIHNIGYWNSDDYIGIGAGAHGRITYFNHKRYETLSFFDYNTWIKNISKGGNGLEIEKILSKKEQVEEIFIMGLRTHKGIDLNNIKKRFDIDVIKYLNMDKVISFQKNGYLVLSDNNIKLTYNGMKILNKILVDILL